MNWLSFGKYRYLLKLYPVILILTVFLLDGCSIGDAKDRDKAIALVQNYQIRSKKVSERLSYALQHSTDEKIESIEWDALKDKKNIYRVTCTVKLIFDSCLTFQKQGFNQINNLAEKEL